MQFHLITLLSASLAAASPRLLPRTGYGAIATFYKDIDCNGDSWDTLYAGADYDNSVTQTFDTSPKSMKVQGKFQLVLHEDSGSCSGTGSCCAYCINYNESDCGDVDTTYCVNIDTGSGVAEANLIGITHISPADLPCKNFQYRCDKFPMPPANGMCQNDKTEL